MTSNYQLYDKNLLKSKFINTINKYSDMDKSVLNNNNNYIHKEYNFEVINNENEVKNSNIKLENKNYNMNNEN